jgi:hypothetical protein
MDPTREIAALTSALRGLEAAILPPPPGASLGNWRWAVRQRLGGVREAVVNGAPAGGADTPSAHTALRERGVLLTRASDLADGVLDRADVDEVRTDLRRLMADAARYVRLLEDVGAESKSARTAG